MKIYEVKFDMFTMSGYNCLKIIRVGHQNTLYSAIRLKDQKPVIVKTLSSDKPLVNEIASLYHEFEVTRDLDCAGIIKTYEILDEQNRYALIQENINGISLAEYILQKPIQDLSIFYTIALQMTIILGDIHRHHIIHKDIKPDNFIIEQQGLKLKLTDFNFAAKLFHEIQEVVPPEKLEGTLAYMAPEQTGRMNMNIDYRSDFYALGVTFYELVTGKLPYTSTDPLEVIHAHLATAAPDASEANPAVPKSLSLLIQKLMAKDPFERYQSAIGCQADLERIAKGESEPFILGYADAHDRLNLSQKLYGRQKEAEILLESYKKASQGSVEALMVSGYSGIGKTTLINEVHKPMVEHKGYFISGKFDQLQRNTPYTAITQAFNQLAKLIMAEPEERFEKIKKALQEAMGNVAQVIIDLAPDLERIFGKQPPLAQLPSRETQNRMMTFFKRFMEVICTKEHPLIIFIDDLQWVDSGSLKLLEYMMTDDALGYVLLIGAYRDNEVDNHHPLRQFLKEMIVQQKSIESLSLGPLTTDHFTALLKDSFNRNEEEIQSLAELIHKRTEGNPFFCKQLVLTLYQQKLLYFDYNTRTWCWKLEGIKELNITDNVIDLMLSKLIELPMETQTLLKFAACVGNRFNINVLMVISRQSADEIAKALWPAMQKEVIQTLNLGYKQVEAMAREELASILSKEIIYKFAHDRVQQAVYQSISKDEKQCTHLNIARSLQQKNPEQCKKERLFEVTDHFNEAHTLLTENEKIMVANLNYEAGMVALSANAYRPMANYFRAGIGLTKQDWWNSQYDLMFKLNRGYAQSLYLIGEIDQAAELVNSLLNQARTTLDKVSIYRIQCVYFQTEGKLSLAIDIAIQALKLLGVKIVQQPSKLDLLLKIVEIKWAKRRQTQEVILTDPNIISALEIMSEINYAVYWVLGNMYAYLGLTAVLLMIRHGTAPSAAVWMTSYAMTVMDLFKDINQTFALWEEAERLIEQKNDKYTAAMAYSYSSLFIIHLRYSFKDGRRYYRHGIQDALESGNLVSAATNMATESLYVWWEGKSLLELIDRSQKALEYCRKIHMNDNVVRFEFQTFLAKTFTASAESDEILLNLYKKVLQVNNQYYRTLATASMALFYFFTEHYDEAYKYHQRWYGQEEKVRWIIWIFNHKTIDALTISKLIPNASYLKKRGYLKRLKKFYKEVQWAANQCPHNYLHQYLLLKATRDRLEGRYLEALDNFNQAIENAKKGDFFLWVGICNELAGEMLFDQGMSRYGQDHIREAHYYYNLHGLKIKVDMLEKRYPECFVAYQSTQKIKASQDSTETFSAGLDFLSVIKASQTISGEIAIEKLFEKMLRIAFENAGAQRALFLEKQRQDTWMVSAILEKEFQLCATPVVDFEDIPQTIVNLALRSKTPIVIADASKESQFEGDTYIKRTHPKSILCLPIVRQDAIIGLIYLENNLVARSFTQDRVTVLNTLTTQMAISLENARHIEHTERLYRATERFVPKPFLKLLNKEHVEDVKLGESIEATLTVLFTDIRGYTTITEGQSPKEAFAFINAYLKVMAPIIRSHGGFINQYQGDGIMALFEQSADDGVRAVKAMNQALRTFNDEQSKLDRPKLSVGYGLNTGQAMLGTIGEEERMDANVISDAINLASRVESLNKYYGTEFLITDSTLKALSDPKKYITRVVDKVRVKGKKNVVFLYEVYFQDNVDENEHKFIDTYEAAFIAYEKGEIKKALDQFRACQKLKPEDKSCPFFIERCGLLLQRPLPEGWDGTYDMTSK